MPSTDPFTLTSSRASVGVDPAAGGRITTLIVDDRELLVTEPTGGSLAYGCYPMAPWAGRIRHGRFEHNGVGYGLPITMGDHAIHGTAYGQEWERTGTTAITTELGPPWPFGGWVEQTFELTDTHLEVTLEVTALDTVMPVMVGWHPWFRRRLDPAADQVELRFAPGAMYILDDEEIPTGDLGPVPAGPWDNCFVGVASPPTLEWPGGPTVALTSSCDHWVVYTEPEHALCVEPQSGAPDEFNRTPQVVAPGEPFERWMRFSW